MAEEQILVIQLRQIGDILLTTPCLRAIRTARPDARITFLSHTMGRLILDSCPYLDEHFVYSSDWGPLEEWRLAKVLKERRFDIVLDFMNNPRSAFYTMMSRGARRVAFRSARWIAYNQTLVRPKEENYIVRTKFKLLQSCGFRPDDEGLVLVWNESHTKPLMQLWGSSASYRESPCRVILSPTHRRPPRRWSLRYYARLADLLVRDWHAAVLWIWGPGEEGVVEQAMSYCQTKTFKAPKTRFREMAALIANADLFVGNSNGPSHVAVATEVPSYQIHGHTSLIAWSPLTEMHRGRQSPEFGKVQIANIDKITVDDVWRDLQCMRPTIMRVREARQSSFPRCNWRL